jgi:site-specific recombinase XerD
VYSPAEVGAVLTHTASLTDLRGRQLHAIIAALRWTGCRAGELSGLRRDRVELPERRLEVLGKGSRPRIVAIPEPLAGVLGAFLGEVRPQLPDVDDIRQSLDEVFDDG